MPTFVSNKGKWYPAKEKIGLTNLSDKIIKYKGNSIKPGEPFVYSGPDREALKMLEKEGREHLGKDFRHDKEFLKAVRTMEFADVDSYLKYCGYDEEQDQRDFNKRAEVTKAHDIPKKVNEIRVMGGGKDYAGNKNDVIGGFGEEKQRTPAELKK